MRKFIFFNLFIIGTIISFMFGLFIRINYFMDSNKHIPDNSYQHIYVYNPVKVCSAKYSNQSAQYFICIIDHIDIDKAINDICELYPRYCPVLTDNHLYRYLKLYYKPALLTIADVEGKFTYKRGIYDKDDISVFQINLKYYSIKDMNRLTKYRYNIKSVDDVIHNELIAGEVALRVWLINVALYIKKYRKFPKSLVEYIALYHSPLRIRHYYKKKVSKVVWRYVNMFNKDS